MCPCPPLSLPFLLCLRPQITEFHYGLGMHHPTFDPIGPRLLFRPYTLRNFDFRRLTALAEPMKLHVSKEGKGSSCPTHMYCSRHERMYLRAFVGMPSRSISCVDAENRRFQSANFEAYCSQFRPMAFKKAAGAAGSEASPDRGSGIGFRAAAFTETVAGFTSKRERSKFNRETAGLAGDAVASIRACDTPLASASLGKAAQSPLCKKDIVRVRGRRVRIRRAERSLRLFTSWLSVK